MIKEELKYYNVVSSVPAKDSEGVNELYDMRVLFSDEEFIDYIKALPANAKYEAEKVMEVTYIPDKSIDMDRVIEDLAMEMKEQM